MQLIRDISTHLNQSVVTIGNFDGLHRGHQALLRQLLQTATDYHCPSVLLTFSPHPTELFNAANAAAQLMRFSEKWEALKSYQIDYFYCARFNHAFGSLSAETFVKTILVDQLQAKVIIVGDDFQFGAKRTGNIETLTMLGKQYGFTVIALPQAEYDHQRISSSRVRKALADSDFLLAETLSHRPFCLSGHVAYGNQIGRTLGFPTANIHLHRKQVPLKGIFVVQVHGVATTPLPGVASIGYRPTFNGKEIILEVFLFDFHQMIYGKKITVEFLEKIRDEEKFDSIDALIDRMKEDVVTGRAYFED